VNRRSFFSSVRDVLGVATVATVAPAIAKAEDALKEIRKPELRAPAPFSGTTGTTVFTAGPTATFLDFRALRRHGRCTCRNNSAWPHCTLCQDWLACSGCEQCHPDYQLDLNNETAKGAPMVIDWGPQISKGHPK